MAKGPRVRAGILAWKAGWREVIGLATRLLAEGYRQSSTFRRLVDVIEQSDLLVRSLTPPVPAAPVLVGWHEGTVRWTPPC